MTEVPGTHGGTRHPVVVGQADLRLRGLLAAGLAQEGQALLEELLELGDRATLEQHVPVGADVLDGLGLGLRAPTWSLASAPQRHSQVCGTSASTEKGSSIVCPLGTGRS